MKENMKCQRALTKYLFITIIFTTSFDLERLFILVQLMYITIFTIAYKTPFFYY